MTKPRLSICIPTYNFGRFIGQTLESIICQLTDDVEIIVVDGASTDNTSDTVHDFQANCPNLLYYRLDKRGGIDRDIATAISFAHGDYCWLFSADDIMMPGSLTRVLDFTKSDLDVYLCEHILCDYEMQPVKEHPIFASITTPEIFDLGNTSQRQRYFSQAITSEAFFSFLSGPIFRKNVWDKAGGIPESFYETCWALAGRLLSVIPGGLVVSYLGEKLLYKRGGNDSFREHGIIARLQISVEGLAHIANTIFGRNSQEAFHIRRVIRNEWPLRALMSIKRLTAMSAKKENIKVLNEIVSKHYSNAGIENKCKYVFFRLIPISVLKLAVSAKNTLIKHCVFYL